MEVVNLARELDLPMLLPAALYVCCKYPIKSIYDGIPSEDGHLLILEEADKRACVIAYSDIRQATTERIHAFLKKSHVQGCTSPELCCTYRLSWLSTHVESRWKPLSKKFDWGMYGMAVCRPCLSGARADFDSARREFWDDLPAMFGLETWDKLESSV